MTYNQLANEQNETPGWSVKRAEVSCLPLIYVGIRPAHFCPMQPNFSAPILRLLFGLRFQFSLFLIFFCRIFHRALYGSIMLHRRMPICLLGAGGSTLSLGWKGLEVGGCWPPCVPAVIQLRGITVAHPSGVSCLGSAGLSHVCQCAEGLFTCSHSHCSPLPTHPLLHTKAESSFPQAHSKMSSVSVLRRKKRKKES